MTNVPEPESRSPGRSALWAAAIAGVAVLLYAGSVDYALVGLDDQVMVVEDHAYNSDSANLVGAFGDNFFDKYYRPLHRITFVLDALRGGVEVSTYHETNLILHAVGSVLVFVALRALGYASALAGVLGLVFAVHPIFASVVAWIPGRDNALVTALILGAFASLIARQESVRAGSRAGWTALHLTLFAAALFTKEMAAVFPAVAIAYLVLCRDERLVSIRNATLVAGWAGALVGWLVLRSRAMRGTPEWESVGLDALTTSFPVPLAVLGKFVAPIGLSAFSTLDAVSVVAGLLAVAALLAAAWSRRVRRGHLVFGACWFLFFLAPTLIQRTGLYDYGEYRAYWVGFGVLVVLAELLRGFQVEFRRPVAMALAGLVIVGLGGRALAYAPVFDGDLNFWSHLVAADPESGWGWFHVGRAHSDRDGDEAAEQAFARAEAVGFPRVDLYVDWSALLLGLERFEEAEAAAARGLEIDAANPYANFNLRLARMHTRRCAEAIPAFEAALEPTRRELLASVPGGPDVFLARAYHHLGGCHRVGGRAQAAALAWESALEADPNRFATYLRLVRLRIERGDLDAARTLAAELRRRGGALTPSLQRKLARPSS